MERLRFGEMGVAEWGRAAAIIRDGGLICLPTDTVYGLACDPGDRAAMDRLFLVKERDRGRPLSLMFADAEQLRQALPPLGEDLWHSALTLLTKPVTVVLPFAGNGEKWGVQPGAASGSIGARIVPARYLKAYSHLPLPIALTSANLSGEPEPRSVDDIPALITAACGLVIDDGTCEHGIPTSVVDLRPLESGSPALLLREGAIGRGAIEQLIGDVR